MKNLIILTFFSIFIFMGAYMVKGDIANLYLNIFEKKLNQDSTNYNLNIRAASSTSILAHSVFFDKVSLFYSEIMLSSGSFIGVTEGALVSTTKGKPVGTIRHVYDTSSKLELFTSSKRETEALLKMDLKDESVQDDSLNLDDSVSSSTTNATTSQKIEEYHKIDKKTSSYVLTLIGDGAYGFTVRVLDSFKISEGDSLYLRNYPELLVGVVASVKDITNENEKIVYIKSNFDRSSETSFLIENNEK